MLLMPSVFADNMFNSGGVFKKPTTINGAYIAGNCTKTDANGLLIDAGAPCGSGGGGGGSGAGFSGSASQGTIGFLDVQGTVTFIGGNSGLYYSGAGSTAGNVGIGSISPGQKLDVNGTTRTKNFTMTTLPVLGSILNTDANGASSWAVNNGNNNAPSNPDLDAAWNLQYRPGDTQVATTTNVAQASIIADGFFFIGTFGASPDNIIRYNEDDLSVTSSVAVGTDTQVGQMTYVKSVDMIFAIAKSGSIYQLNPHTMAITKVVTNTWASNQFTSITNDGTYLYALNTNTGLTNIIYQYAIAGFGLNSSLTLTGITTASYIGYDGTNLYLTTGGIPSTVIQVPLPAFSAFSSATLTGCSIGSDDNAITADYLYAGCENSQNIARVRKSDLSYILIPMPNESYGTYYDGKYVWNSSAQSNNIERLDPLTNEVSIIPLPAAFTSSNPNEIVGDGNRLFLSLWNSGTGPSQVGRITTTQVPSTNINYNSNVGIFNNSPAQQLDVNGTVKMVGFQMNTGSSLNGKVLTADASGNGNWSAVTGTGTVTTVSVVNANGLNGTVANATTTPAITLTTTANGVLLGNGTAISASNIITDTGTNVGISSATPGQKLDVQGTIRTTGFTLPTSPTNGYVLTSDANGKGTWQPSSGGGSTLWNTTNTNDVYEANGATFGNVAIGTSLTTGAALTVVAAGLNSSFSTNVGINSAAPGQSLDVQGTTRSTNFVGAGAGLTGTAASLTAGTVTTNANLTGPITSVGNTTSVASQTGTGSTFVMNTSPTLVTPALGTPSSGVVTNLTGTAAGLTAGTVTTNANLTGPITSSGNATSIAAQTGTGTTFVTQAGSPNFTGNVGVNSANPGQRVDVQGTVRATAFVGDGSALTGIPLGSAVVGTLSVNNGGSQWIGTGIGPLTYSLGNVGIGSANPGQILDIQGTVRMGSALGTTISILNNGGYTQTGISANTFTGNVGIGIAAPTNAALQAKVTTNIDLFVNNQASKLGISAVNDAVGANVPMDIRASDLTVEALGTATLTLTANSGSSTLLLGSTAGGGANFSAGNLGINSALPGQKLDIQGTERILNGNLGIGSSSPGQALDVQGSVRIFGVGSLSIGSSNPGGTLDVEGTVNPTIFYATGSSNQNVGIGSPTPGFKLDVVGGIRTLGNTNNTTLNTTGGNVGIGTTVPNQNFTIKGSTASQWGSPIPVITSCGTSPSVKGTDHDFQITVGSITATGCTATFGGTYQDATCNISNQSMSITSALGYTVSSSAIVISQATGLVGDLLNVHCDFKN